MLDKPLLHDLHDLHRLCALYILHRFSILYVLYILQDFLDLHELHQHIKPNMSQTSISFYLYGYAQPSCLFILSQFISGVESSKENCNTVAVTGED